MMAEKHIKPLTSWRRNQERNKEKKCNRYSWSLRLQTRKWNGPDTLQLPNKRKMIHNTIWLCISNIIIKWLINTDQPLELNYMEDQLLTISAMWRKANLWLDNRKCIKALSGIYKTPLHLSNHLFQHVMERNPQLSYKKCQFCPIVLKNTARYKNAKSTFENCEYK